MRVQKRDNTFEDISFDKVLRRIRNLCEDLPGVDADEIAQKVCARIYDGVKTSELDELAAQMCATLVTTHPDYGTVAARIIVSNHHKNTSPSFSETIGMLYHATDVHKKHNPLITQELWEIVQAHKEKLNSVIDYQRDFLFDYFGFKTLERSYLIKVDGRIVERPQHLWMRVALGIHGWDIKEALETYEYMSTRMFTHATPTLFNAGTPRSQMSSCYLIQLQEDSIQGIYKTLGDCAQISKYAGGIGMHIHNVRAKGAYIRGTNGTSTGIIPMLRVFNDTARYVNQCFGKDTIVYSSKGPKTVDSVTEGEELVTIDGSFRKVLGISRKHIGKDILKVRPTHSMESVEVTKEHEIYTIQGVPKMTNYDTIRKQLHSKQLYPIFTAAGNLREGDFVGFPIPCHVEDADESEEFFRILGIILGDGHATKHKNSRAIEFGVTLGETKADTFTFVCNFLHNRGVHFWTSKDLVKHTLSIRWTQNLDVLNISYNDIYDMQHHKVIPAKYLHLPDTKTLALLHGLLETDGSCYPEVQFCSTSKELVYQTRYLLLRLGILSSGHPKKAPTDNGQRDRNGVPYTIRTVKQLYVLRIPKHPRLRAIFGDRIQYSTTIKYFTWNNMLWSRIRSIEHVEYNGYVYDFNMEDNHNYLTDMGLVHNSGRRNGSIAVYIEPWHADVESFMEIRKNHGAEEERCRDLFSALWVNDLFMQRVQANADWSLMCPDECPGLSDVYGDAFQELYERYEAEGRYKKKIKAQQLWYAILKSQIESGTPYLCYKDAANQKSNQANIGVIKSSNLCVEVTLVSNENETAVCNLASISLPAFVKRDGEGTPMFDFDGLHKITQVITRNINKVIDRNFYPTPETELSNKRHRPIGIGIQGLADVFAMLKLPFDSAGAHQINKEIFETIYHGALTASMKIAKRRGEWRDELDSLRSQSATSDQERNRMIKLEEMLHLLPEESKMTEYRGAYSTFQGSPISQGRFQFDLWGAKPEGKWDWESLKEDILKYGIRNSMLLAPMPTASTSQILGNTESFEPITSNIFQRQTLAGEFTIINKHLVKDLMKLNLWSVDMKNKILLGGGSIQHIQEIPEDIRALYKTAWEIKQKVLIDQAADRGIYVCQSQSLNLFVEDPDLSKLTNMHFYAWKKGLKTGIYYLRTRPKAKMAAFTLEAASAPVASPEIEAPVCRRDDPTCAMCSA
jgi:ribonucleotide reductase alpha subunit